jgi:putative exporter of polyketide antibiotics
MKSHRGSSLVYLGLSLILFVITYGIAFLLMPMIFGEFYDQLNQQLEGVDNPEWVAIGVEVEGTVQYLVPLMPSLGIVIIIIKVIMTASARGRD